MNPETLHPDGYHAPTDPINYFHTIPSPEVVAYQRLTKIESVTQKLALGSGILSLSSCALGSEVATVLTAGTTFGFTATTITIKAVRRALFKSDLE